MQTSNKKTSFSKLLKEYAFLFLGCLLTAISVTFVLKPSGLSTSGITGFSIILEHVININYTYINYAITVVIVIASYLLMGKLEVMRIIAISIIYSTLLVILDTIDYAIVLGDNFLVVVTFSVLYGTGVGLVLKRNYSYGGTDTIAKILQKKVFPFVSVGQVLLAVDGLIIIFSAFVLSIEIALYGLVIQIIVTKVLDYVMFGIGTKLYKHEIISEYHEEISDFMVKELKRGVTIKKIVGAYTKQEKIQLSCVCSPKESVLIKKYLAKKDPKAYVEIVQIVGVWGTGSRFQKIAED